MQTCEHIFAFEQNKQYKLPEQIKNQQLLVNMAA